MGTCTCIPHKTKSFVVVVVVVWVFCCPSTLFRSLTYPHCSWTSLCTKCTTPEGTSDKCPSWISGRERVVVEITSCRTQKIRTLDLYACVLVRKVIQRCADLMRIKWGSRLKNGIRKFIQVVFFKKNPTEKVSKCILISWFCACVHV